MCNRKIRCCLNQGQPRRVAPTRLTGLINTAGTKFTCSWFTPLNFLATTLENINNLTLYLRHASKKRKSKKKNCAKIWYFLERHYLCNRFRKKTPKCLQNLTFSTKIIDLNGLKNLIKSGFRSNWLQFLINHLPTDFQVSIWSKTKATPA